MLVQGEMKQKRKGAVWQSQRRPQVALPLWTLQLCWDVCFCHLCAVFSFVALHTENEPSLILPSVNVFSSYSCLSSACLPQASFFFGRVAKRQMPFGLWNIDACVLWFVTPVGKRSCCGLWWMIFYRAPSTSKRRTRTMAKNTALRLLTLSKGFSARAAHQGE